jgi:hypothetical protein
MRCTFESRRLVISDPLLDVGRQYRMTTIEFRVNTIPSHSDDKVPLIRLGLIDLGKERPC